MRVPKARKLKSGTWFIQLRLGGESIPVTGKTERECIKQAEYVKSQYLVGKRKKPVEPDPEPPEPERITLGEAVDKYIAVRTNVRSPSTIRGYMTIRRNRFKDTMPRYLDEIDDDEWKEICNREAALCAPKTLKNAWGFVSSAIAEATKKKIKGVNLAQVPKTDLPFLEPEQLEPFIEAILGTTSEITGLLALSSLRRSEIKALCWESIDLEKKIIHVHGATVVGEKGLVQRKQNKNDTSYRTVPILMDELYDLLMQGKAKNPTGAIVTCHPNTIWNRIKKICKMNGFPDVGVHGLRRSFVSLAYHLGIDEDLTMEIGGWNDSKIMREHYKRLARSDIRKQSTRLINFYKKVPAAAITVEEAIDILKQQQENCKLDSTDFKNVAPIMAAYDMAIEELSKKQKEPEAS